MKRWQALSLAGVTLFVAGAAGFCLGRPSEAPAPMPSKEPVARTTAQAPVAEAPVAPAPAPKAPSANLETAAAPPAGTAKKSAAGKAGPRLPAALARRLKLDGTQETAVGAALQDWESRLKEINLKKRDALGEAKKIQDRTLRAQMEAAAAEAWRQEYAALKDERTQNLTQAFTPEQAADYRAFRDQKYQAWLDQKTTLLLTTAKAVLGLTPQQVDQLKPAVRQDYDQVTLGGTVVPSAAVRENAELALRQRVQAMLTPDQLKKFEMLKSSLVLR